MSPKLPSKQHVVTIRCVTGVPKRKTRNWLPTINYTSVMVPLNQAMQILLSKGDWQSKPDTFKTCT